MGQLDSADPPAVADYVARNYRRVGPADQALDAFDVLVITRWQARRLDLRTRNMITIARDGIDPETNLRPTWARLAKPLGVKTHAAALQLYQRLLAWSEPLDHGLETGGLRSHVTYRRQKAEQKDPDARVTYPSPRDPAPTTAAAVTALLQRMMAIHQRDVPEDLVDDLAAALSSPNPANTLGLVRAVVADLMAVADVLPAQLEAIAREAHNLLHR